MSPPPYLYWNTTHGLIKPDSNGVYFNATKCDTNDWVNTDASNMNIVYYVTCACIATYGMYAMLKKKKEAEKRKKTLEEKKKQDEEFGKNEQIQARRLTLEEEREITVLASPEQKFGKWTFLSLMIAIIIDIYLGIYLTIWKVQKLTIDELDATNDADNYLQPFEDIFQFFEDGMTVRVGQALGSAEYITAGLLIRWAALGGFASGLIGACISTGLTFIPAVFSFFVPTTTSSALPKDCPIIPTISDIQSLARPYWILTSFSWIAAFMNKASIGFFMGTGETQFWAISTVAQSAASVAIFWALIDNDNISHTTTTGLLNLIPPIVFLIFTFICFGRKKYIELFGLTQKNMFTPNGLKISYQAAVDGGHLLLKDFLLTVQKSMALIMAAHIGLGSQYQLLIYSTIEGVFGYSYGAQNSGSGFAIAMGYGIRLTGARFLGGGNFKAFKYMAKSYFIGTNLVGIVAFVSIYIFRDAIPYNYASDTLCQYAEYECSIDTYNDVFYRINIGMSICGLMCWFNCVFSILQAILYAALDFKFMRNATVLCFVIVFLPSAIVSYYKYKSVIGLLVSINLPILALIILYSYRLFFVIMPNLETFVKKRMHDTSNEIEFRKSLLVNDD